MLLQELLGVKRFHGMTKTQLLQYILQANEEGETKLKPIGGGTAATVFSDGEGSVYKFWSRDGGYEAFIAYVAKHQDNPFLPKMKGKVKSMRAFHKRPEVMPDNLRWVKLEELQPNIKGGDYSVKFHDLRVSVIQLINYFISLSDITDSDDKIRRELDRLTSKQMYIKGAGEYIDELMLLCRTSVDIGNIIKGDKKLSNDMMEFNVMLRNGFPVIIDPIGHLDDHPFNNLLDRVEHTLNNGKSKSVSGPKKVSGRAPTG